MSNALAAYYAYRSMVDRDTVRVFRAFGYFASADHVERRADRYATMAQREEAPADEPTGASCFPSSNHGDDDLHTTSDSDEQTGVLAGHEPPR